jgi:hypothetical protein
MRDSDIRQALHASELNAHRDEPDTLVLDELGICQGDYRIDIAVVNGSLHGIEIKSDRDTLNRLLAQAEAYSKVFDTMCIVAGRNHIDGVAAMVPQWWTLRAATDEGGAVVFEDVREGQRNPSVDPLSVVQLLWREEAVALLEVNGGARGFRGKSRHIVWAELAARLSPDELRCTVRQQLKARQGWR